MKLYAPAYYKQFKCIADQCEHNCCIGWEIDIDKNTLDKYKKMRSGYGAVIRSSISMEDTPHFTLGRHDRCPHLDEQGLCKIIINEGEAYLCEICRQHPRFYNYTRVVEVGLGMSCREAARIILSSPDYSVLTHVGDVEAEADEIDFDGRVQRGHVYALLQDTACPYTERLNKIYRRYSIEPGEDDRWLYILDSLEYLDDHHRTLFTAYSSSRRPSGLDTYLERFLAYVVYRHCTEAVNDDDFCARLAFCLFCERLLASLICSENAQSLQEISVLASMISEEIEYSEDNTFVLQYGSIL